MFTRILFRLLLLLGVSTPMLGQWTQLPGPSGGEIRSLAVRGVTAIAINDLGKIFRNDGANWSPLNTMNALQVFCIGGAYYADDFGNLIRSTNNGETWQETGLERSIMSMVRLQGKSNVLVASDRTALFRSTNGGIGWDSIAAFGPNSYMMDVDADGAYIYGLSTGEAGTILRRMHADSTQWSNAVATYPSTNIASRMEVADGVITIYYFNDGIFRSSDAGATWDQVNTGLPTQSFIMNDLIATHKGLFASTTHGVYKLKGETWQRVLAQRDAQLATTNSEGVGELWAATASGVLSGGDDGETWTAVNAGLNVHSIKNIVAVGNAILAAAPAGIFRSTNEGMAWEQTVATPILQMVADGNTVLALHENYGTPGLSRSSDGGITWTAATTNLPEPLLDLTGIAAADGVFYLSSGNGGSVGVWRSTDGCATWQRASAGLPANDDQTPVPINAIAAQGTSVIAVTASAAYWSGDAGASWQASDLQIDGMSYRPVAAAAAGQFYLGNIDTLYSSADSGKTWEVEPILKDGESTILAIASVGQSAVVLSEFFVGLGDHPTAGMMWHNGGWSTFTDRLPEKTWLMSIASSGNQLFVGTWGSGLMRAATAEVLGQTSSAPGAFINAFKLAAYPNPVTADARIHFTLERPGHVVIELVNPLGATVKTLFEGDVDAGDHAVVVDASQLPSGVWFYRLTSSGESVTEKFVKP